MDASRMRTRGGLAVGMAGRWLPRVVQRTLAAFPDEAPRDAFDDLASMLARDGGVIAACKRGERRMQLRFTAPDLAMRVVHPEWGLPRLDTTADVARWLGLEIGDLAWFADWHGLARHDRPDKLAHYTYRWVPKRSGGARLLEAPKRWLKDLSRRILHEIVGRIPPHEAAHGFRRGRSIVTHAAHHVACAAVLRMDLEDFFSSIPAGRVFGVFRAVGYPQEVSRVLTGLCTTRAPAQPFSVPEYTTTRELSALHRSRMRYRARHLPQGAPTSPALANLCAYGLDVRLRAAANSMGAAYTRYADDLVFSGDERLGRAGDRFAALVAGIAMDEAFTVNHRKTRLMRASTRQRVTGLVVNEAPSIPRADFDRLKATIHNSIQHGPESQNRGRHPDFRAHLEGKVAWLSHVQPARGAKLAAMLEAIRWPT